MFLYIGNIFDGTLACDLPCSNIIVLRILFENITFYIEIFSLAVYM